MAPSDIEDQINNDAIIRDLIQVQPVENNNPVFLTLAFLFQCMAEISVHLTTLRGQGLAALRGVRQLWPPGAAFGEEGVVVPRCALNFIITCLLAFAEIKSQGDPRFPFQTHHWSVMVSVTSLLIYGFASAAENLMISAMHLNLAPIYKVIARFGRIGSLCILVASLSSLFYF